MTSFNLLKKPQLVSYKKKSQQVRNEDLTHHFTLPVGEGPTGFGRLPWPAHKSSNDYL